MQMVSNHQNISCICSFFLLKNSDSNNFLRYKFSLCNFRAVIIFPTHYPGSSYLVSSLQLSYEIGKSMVDFVCLYDKNIRRFLAYQQAALNELIAQIKCLGLPTYLITFSCNDLHWFDRKQTLLIADAKANDEPSFLEVYSTQKLIEQYVPRQ